MDEIITREEAAALLVDATPRSCPKCKGRGYIANYPQDSRFCDACDASGGLRGNEVVASLASTVVALHDRIADLEATLAAERGDPAGALPGWRWDGSSWVRIAENGDRLRVQRVAILGRPVLWSWVIGRQGHGVIAGDANDPDAWIPTAREAMRAADAAATPTNPRVVIVEPATACPNDASRSATCADPESCAKYGCGYLESLGDGEVKS